MMSRHSNWISALGLIAFAALFVSGCVPVEDQQTEMTSTTTEPSVSVVELPDVDITAQLLSDLIGTEIEYNRFRSDESIEQQAAIAAETEDYRIVEVVAQRAYNAGRFDIADRTTLLWVELTPMNAHAWWVRGVTQVATNDFDGAVDSFIKTLELSPDRQSALFSDIARAVSSATYPQLTYDMFKKIAGQFQNANAYQILVRFAVATEEDQQVIDDYLAMSYELEPHPQTAVLRFSLYLEQDKEDEAVAYIQRKINKYPDSDDLKLAYAEYFMQIGEPEKALEQLSKAATPEALQRAGRIYYRSNDLDAALDKFTEYVERSPEDTNALLSLAEIQIELGNFEDCRDTLNRITDRQFHFEKVILEARFASEVQGIDAGIRILGNLPLNNESEQIRTYIAINNLYSSAGQWVDAKLTLDEAIEIFPEDTQLRLARSFVAAELQLIELVESDIQSVLSRDSQNAAALNALGYTLTDLTDRHDEALAFIEQALELRPNDPYILDSMGWVHYRLGNFDLALEFLQKAYRLRLDPVIAAHLGEVLWSVGEKNQAKVIWQSALDIDSENETLLETVEKFTN